MQAKEREEARTKDRKIEIEKEREEARTKDRKIEIEKERERDRERDIGVWMDMLIDG